MRIACTGAAATASAAAASARPAGLASPAMRVSTGAGRGNDPPAGTLQVGNGRNLLDFSSVKLLKLSHNEMRCAGARGVGAISDATVHRGPCTPVKVRTESQMFGCCSFPFAVLLKAAEVCWPCFVPQPALVTSRSLSQQLV